jgi:uncharacterized protein YkwD
MFLILAVTGYHLYQQPPEVLLNNIKSNFNLYTTAIGTHVLKGDVRSTDFRINLSESYDFTKDPSRLIDSDANEALVAEYIFVMTNELREEKGIRILGRHKDLDKVAQYYADDMNTREKGEDISHTDDLGRSPKERAEFLGVKTRVVKGELIYTGIGENLAWFGPGFADNSCERVSGRFKASSKDIAHCVLQGWIESRGHYENLISENYDQIGIGVAFGESGEYFVQNFR